jgi:hypothetical protein
MNNKRSEDVAKLHEKIEKINIKIGSLNCTKCED